MFTFAKILFVRSSAALDWRPARQSLPTLDHVDLDCSTFTRLFQPVDRAFHFSAPAPVPLRADDAVRPVTRATADVGGDLNCGRSAD